MAYVSYLVGEELAIQDGSLKVRVEDVYDAVTARALAWAFCPVISAGLLKQDITVTNIGYGIFDATVDYGTLPPRDDPSADPSWSFDIQASTLHIVQAVTHVADYPNGTKYNHKGAINVADNGSGKKTPQGVDVYVPTFAFEETHQLPYNLVSTHGWTSTIENLTGKVNSAAWRIWNKGEVLFMGASGQKQAELAVSVTFRFQVSKTQTGLSFGEGADEITGVDKEGWHYLWCEYKDDPTPGVMVKTPIAVHVEQVYDYADFSLLGLFDPWN